VLLGRTPDDASIPDFVLDRFTLPTELPVTGTGETGPPAPDVQAAEAQLHQATAAVGIATANLYPQLNLTGSIGSESVTSGGLFGAGTGTWSVVRLCFSRVPRRRASLQAACGGRGPGAGPMPITGRRYWLRWRMSPNTLRASRD